MFEFPCLKYLRDILTHPRYTPNLAKIQLADRIEEVLELEGQKSAEEANDILRSKITNELKKDLIDVLSEKSYLPSLAEVGLAKLINEVPKKMKQKIVEIKQLEAKNKDLQTKKDQVEQLNRVLGYLQNIAQNGNIELKTETDKLNTQIQQLQQKKKILEIKNEATEQLREKATYIVTASTVLAIGLAVYIVLEHTVRLDTWITVGIAVASALIATGLTYLALKSSTQVNETQGVANKNSVA